MKITSGSTVKRKTSLIAKKLQHLEVCLFLVTLPIDFMDNYSKDTTIHGVKYFSEKKRHWTEKTFWIAIFIISIALCVQNVINIYEKRQAKPVMISIAKDLTSTFEIPFPAVTICPETKVTVHEMNLSEVLKKDVSTLDKTELLKLKALYQVCDFADHKALTELLNETKIERDIILSLNNFSIPMNEILSRCQYGSRKFVDCDKLFYKVISDEGACFTFNMLDQLDLFDNSTLDPSIRLPNHGKSSDWFLEKDYESPKIKVFPYRVFGSGVDSGLALELRMKKSEINPGCKRGIQGFRLSLHTPVELPLMSKNFFHVPFNKQTLISVKPLNIYPSKDVREYESSRRECFFHNERRLKFFKTYSKSSCHAECLAERTLKACGCVKFSMPRDNQTKICDLSSLDCAQEAEFNYTMSGLERKLLSKQLKRDLKHGKMKKGDEAYKIIEKKLKSMEACNCLPSCTALRYDAEISQTDFFIDDIDEYSTASIKIYFKSAHFSRLKRYEAYGLSDFLSSTGGIFGLFLGCSVISFIELIYHLIAYCVRKVRKSTSEIGVININTESSRF